MCGNFNWLAYVLGQNHLRSGKIESYAQWKKTLEDLEARKVVEDKKLKLGK